MTPTVCFSFKAFGMNFTIATDSPEEALLCPALKFGAVPVASAPDDLQWPRPRTLSLFRDHARSLDHARALACAESVRIGEGRKHVLRFDTALCRGAATLPRSKAGATRTALFATNVFVRLALKSKGIFFLHASAAVADGGAAVFAGENESGKSTLARALACRGWKLFSDDGLPIFMRGKKVFALQSREAINSASISRTCRKMLADAGFTPATLGGFVHAPDYGGRAIPVKLVFLPRWSGSRPRPRTADRAFALKALYNSCATPLFLSDLPLYDKLIGTLVYQAGNYHLDLRKGRYVRPETVSKLVNTCMNESKVEAVPR